MRRNVRLLLACIAFATLAACNSSRQQLDLSLNRRTTDALYQVAVQSLGDPIVINKMHAWEIRLRSPSGKAVSGARISVDGGMPEHGHGFPTQPSVTRELGDGRYLLEGMKFSMPGWWEIKLRIDSEAGIDEVTFNTVIPSAPAPYSDADRVAQS